jgi:hypothetical protein
VHGEEDHLGGNLVRSESVQGLEPAHAGHGEVGHDDVWPELAGRVDQPRPVGHRPRERELALEEGDESLEQNRVVVGEQHRRAGHELSLTSPGRLHAATTAVP